MLDQSPERLSVGAPGRPFRLQRRPEERVRVLGGEMDLVKSTEVFHFAEGKIRSGQKAIVANHNLHSLYLARKNTELRRFFSKSDLIEVDSIPLILWARLIGKPSRRFHRCTYLDWRDEFWSWVERNEWRVFFVGGQPGVAAKASEKIRAERPGVRLETHHGYFDTRPGSEANQSVLAEVRTFAPDILLVGMGMPVQETWVLRNYDNLPACVVFTVGGAFDYEAGIQLPCPRWLGRLGGEWLFRLVTRPNLFSRYVVEPWRLIGPAISDISSAARRTSLPRRAGGKPFEGSRSGDSIDAGPTIA